MRSARKPAESPRQSRHDEVVRLGKSEVVRSLPKHKVNANDWRTMDSGRTGMEWGGEGKLSDAVCA